MYFEEWIFPIVVMYVMCFIASMAIHIKKFARYDAFTEEDDYDWKENNENHKN